MRLNLTDYQISLDLAFVLKDPLTVLPPYYQAWNHCAENIGILNSSGHLRNLVDQIPILNVDSILTDHKSLRLAHVQLSTLISGYIWCSGEEDVPRHLPENLALPFWRVCSKLGFEPGIASHVGLALANYKLKDPEKPVHIDNLNMMYFKFLEDYGNDWFFLLTTQIELDFADALPAMLEIIQLPQSDDISSLRLLENLKVVCRTIDKMDDTLCRMGEHLEPDVFFYGFRPFLAGTTSGLYKKWGGIIFNGVDCQPKKLIGGSAAQSATLQVLDGLLNIEHEKSESQYCVNVRNYILPQHKAFIEKVTNESRLRSHILKMSDPNSTKNKSQRNDHNFELIETYNKCVTNLVRFRNRHVQIVTKFILCPQYRKQDDQNLIGGKMEDNKFKTLNDVGTGGTGIMPFLKSLRDSTLKSLIVEQSGVQIL